MKFGVVSDTHRNRAYLRKAVEWMMHCHRISFFYHLGDDYEDVFEFADEDIDIVQVPGIYHPGYRDGSLSPKTIETVLGVRIMLVHDMDRDITREDKAVVDVILHGHTHKPEMKLADGHFTMNPGHLKSASDKNTKPSFGMLEITERKVCAFIFSLDFEEIDTMEMVRAETGLFRV